MDASYAEFLARKAPRALASGFEPMPIPDHLFDFQKAVVEFAVRQGRAGVYLDTGLGKTRVELEWSWQCLLNSSTSSKALILTPLAVAKQMEREGQALGYDCRVIRDQTEVKAGINICNYDRLDKLDADDFGSIALDESSILKSFGGKQATAIIALFAGHRYRLSATATPAPNDHMELGQQSSFLGIMPANEMLMRWFINDTAEASQQWRLKGHAQGDFWSWMASWSRMAQSPEDLGFDGSRYVLPELKIIRHRTNGNVKPTNGGLFVTDMSATNMFNIKKQTSSARAKLAASIIHESLSCGNQNTPSVAAPSIGMTKPSEIAESLKADGFTLHSRVTIWKDPVVEMTRTKALGLLFKQLQKDSGKSRMGMPDYLLVFKAPGENDTPITHTPEEFPVSQWQQWASPVWMDIRQTNTLNVKLAKENMDEKHVCPLQLDLIERALVLWSNPGDVVWSPFMGIGSEGYVSLKLKRKFIGTELKEAYWKQACGNMESVEAQGASLFDAVA